MSESIKIKVPKITVAGGRSRIEAEIEFPGKQIRTLWFECDQAYGEGLTAETSDAFVISILLPAMREGVDIVVEGGLSSKLYYNLTSYYVELLAGLIRGLHKVRIEAKCLTRETWGGTGVLSGYSGGVDSFCTIFDHSLQVSPEYRTTHLLFNNVGSHGQTARDPEIFLERFERLEKEARQVLSMPLIAVNSNLDSFIQMNFQLTATLRNIAVALLFQRICAKFLYSSSVHYRDSSATFNMPHADAIGVSLLSTETMECISSGGQHTRFEKTEIVSTKPVTYHSLDVCVSPTDAKKINCSRCWKCLRTELSLEVIGLLRRYEPVFDLDRYRRYRWLHICDALGSRDLYQAEIRAGMKKYKFSTPLSARIAAALIPNFVIRNALWLWWRLERGKA